MSFLEPLFLLGAVAIGAPIFFHLIRRSPRGRLRFSSLMFLRQSRPRITRRSRLDNWLLLLLRVTALILLALAFARPYFREAVNASALDAGRHVAFLVDTSASMRREGLWTDALAKVDAVLDEIESTDRLALFTFNREVVERIALEKETAVPVDEQKAQVRRVLAGLSPTWASSRLGDALVTVADSLDAFGHDAAARGLGSDALFEVVLVSDVQEGSYLESLDAYDWPDRIRLRVERATSPERSNAGLVVLPDDELATGNLAEVRVRVTNEDDAEVERFSLRWADPAASPSRETETETETEIETETETDTDTDDAPSWDPARDALQVEVPAGESRVVKLPVPPPGFTSTSVLLEGDKDDFDNTYHVVPPQRAEIFLAYVGDDGANDASGLRYYLERALESGFSATRIVEHDAGEPLSPEQLLSMRMVVVTKGIAPPLADSLREYASTGGTVLCVLTDAAVAMSLIPLFDRVLLHSEEVEGGEYKMLSEIDFGHPLFAPFADPRFSDFTKVRFFRHRRLRVEPVADSERESSFRTIARFDDGDPALLESLRGRGRILIFTSGWHPADSQLARSTKFVPLVTRMIDRDPWGFDTRSSYAVGDPITLPPARREPSPITVRGPDGAELTVDPADGELTETGRPGIYEIELEGERRSVAVNLDPEESLTGPLAVEELEERGVRLGTTAEEVDHRRQLLDKDLEKRQKVWKWGIVAALLILIIETWLAGYLDRGRRSARREEATA